jgi:hypothetical protein
MVDLIIEGVICDLSDDISADITYSLADIRTPDKRQVNYSKTITLVGTAKNNYIFGNIFDIDVENPDVDATLPNVGVNFTPKKLAKAQMLSDGIQIFDGTLRLWKVSFKGGFIYYEVSLFGKLFDLFGTMGEKKLTDIDFSEFNHALTWANIISTWQDNFNGAFRYPLVDYGVNVANESGQPATFKFGSLVASLHYKVLIDKIFATNSANYVLNFTDRTIFDKLIVTPNTGQIKATPKYFAATLTNDSRLYLPPAQYSEVDEYGQTQWYYSYSDDNLNCFDAVSSNSILYGIPAATPYRTFRADVSTSFQFKFEVEVNEFYDDFHSGNPIIFRISKQHANVYPKDVAVFHLYLNPNTKTYSVTMEVPKTDFIKDDDIIPIVRMCEGVSIRIKAGATVKAVSPNDANEYPLVIGDLYDVNQSVPTDWKQVDFIKDFIKLFNLFVTQQPDDPKTYIFTPANNFYSSDKAKVIDWTNKIDRNNDIEFTPLSQLTAKSYILTWKQDKDYWSDTYFNTFKEVYGQIAYLTDTDVLSNTETIEFLFSPAVMQRYDNSNVLCAGIYKVEANNGTYIKKADKFNSRLLIWGGLKDAGHGIGLLKPDGSTDSTSNFYPYAGHIDDPMNPTFDLNFGNTNSDLATASKSQFSVYWGKTLREANNKDGKLISCSALITAEDVEKLDFSALYRVDNQFYRLNKISSFNPFDIATSQIELIKVISLS